MKYILLAAFLFCTYPALTQQKIQYIKMSRSKCAGKCPEYEVELNRNGSITWNGTANVARKGFHTAQLSAKDMAAFFAEFEQYDFKKLRTRYTGNAVGKPHLDLEIRTSAAYSKIKGAEGGPGFLQRMGTRIDQKIKNLKWKAIRFIPPQIVDDSDDDPPPVQTIMQDGEDNVVAGDRDIAEYPSESVTVAEDVFTFAEEMPEFPGGMPALMKYMQTGIQYPAIAREAGISGKVFCSFVVDQYGNITKVHIVKGIAPSLDQEAVRVIKMMPRWNPGKMHGKAVKVKYTLPVNFVLK